jgi:hypothetical protein
LTVGSNFEVEAFRNNRAVLQNATIIGDPNESIEPDPTGKTTRLGVAATADSTIRNIAVVALSYIARRCALSLAISL